MLVVGNDCDGCYSNFGDECRAYLKSIGKAFGYKDNGTEPHSWDFYEYWGMDRLQFKAMCDDAVDAGYIFAGPPRPGAIEANHALAAAGHYMVYITDRFFGSKPENSHAATCRWFQEYDLYYDELIFSADKTCRPTDIFIEDKWENAVALEAAGTQTWLINRPWNLEYDWDKRIDDISQWPAVVEEFAHTNVV